MDRASGGGSLPLNPPFFSPLGDPHHTTAAPSHPSQENPPAGPATAPRPGCACSNWLVAPAGSERCKALDRRSVECSWFINGESSLFYLSSTGVVVRRDGEGGSDTNSPSFSSPSPTIRYLPPAPAAAFQWALLQIYGAPPVK